MHNLRPPDLHYVNAACGWLELGNPAEARQELKAVTPANLHHPAVLEVWWDILAVEKEWESALSMARQIIIQAPSLPSGWINQSFTLHELRRTREALECLLPVVESFPTVGTIPYNLACYACQLNEKDESLRWLKKAVSIDGRDQIKAMALHDPDLQPLRPLIAKI